MKKLMIAFCILMMSYTGNACDICGCGVGSNYIGILPEFSKNIIGFRYRYNSLQTHLDINGNATYLTTIEQYHTLELWSAWQLGKKIRIMPVIPYAFNERANQGNNVAKNGLGDISFTGFYQLVNKRSNVFTDKLLVQSLWVGSGIKLPTGKYEAADKQNTAQNANLFQLGTGSTDFSFNVMYDIRLQDAGLNLSGGYKLNTSNRHDYQYGNKLSSSAQCYYKFRLKKSVGISPNTGISVEYSAKDNDGGYTVAISGGNICMATIGLESTFKKVSLGANFQRPILQNLANGAVKANDRLMVHLSYAF